MRTGPEHAIKLPSARSGHVWLAAAVMLGALVGASLEPLRWPDGETALATDVKLLGWLVVAVLCCSTGAMAWLAFGRELPRARVGSPPMLETQAPINQAYEPASAPPPRPADEPEPRAPLMPAAHPASESPAPPVRESDPGTNGPFLAALDYLGHAQATIRVGGILAIERAARASANPADLTACAGTLAAYVQQFAASDIPPKAHPGFDVVAALAVLTRLLPAQGDVRDLVNLRRTRLAGLELPHADFSRFHMENSDLSGADLRGCNLSGVNFRGADLRGALLAGAVFTGASLRAADLTGAILSDGEFGPADLSLAGNLAAVQLLHVRYQPNRPPLLPAGLRPPLQSAAVAV